jgi:hypothetical protein
MHTIVFDQARRLLLAVVLGSVAAPSAFAITARDVMEKMSKQERYSYLTGLIEMRAFYAAQAGDAALPKCAYDAYYRGQNSGAWRSACLAGKISREAACFNSLLLVDVGNGKKKASPDRERQ